MSDVIIAELVRQGFSGILLVIAGLAINRLYQDRIKAEQEKAAEAKKQHEEIVALARQVTEVATSAITAINGQREAMAELRDAFRDQEQDGRKPPRR